MTQKHQQGCPKTSGRTHFCRNKRAFLYNNTAASNALRVKRENESRFPSGVNIYLWKTMRVLLFCQKNYSFSYRYFVDKPPTPGFITFNGSIFCHRFLVSFGAWYSVPCPCSAGNLPLQTSSTTCCNSIFFS